MKAFMFLVLTFSGTYLFSNNLQISNIQWNEVNQVISFSVTWDNSWRDVTGDFRDAAWVFVKYRPSGGQWKHALIQSSGALPSGMTVDEPTDLRGAFIHRSVAGNGSTPVGSYNFDLLVSSSELGPYPDFKVFGIEMVYIPQGPFYFGGPSTSGTLPFVHRGDNFNNGLLITSEGQITFGNSITEFSVSNNTSPDWEINIPASYPKGYNSFYCMKYEITQIQYADFLNCLTIAQQQNRVAVINLATPYALSNTTSVSGRNGIRYAGMGDEGNHLFGCDLNGNGIINEIDDGQNLGCNYLSRLDLAAYLDWAALRPMSGVEIFKICRGPSLPVTDELAWGSSFNNSVTANDLAAGTIGKPGEVQSSAVNYPHGNTPMRSGFAATATSDRFSSGATYYGVMEMSGSVAENVVDFEGATYLSFEGSLGDGELDQTGHFTNIYWKMSYNGRMGPSSSYTLVNLKGGAGNSGGRSSSFGGRGVRQ
jgi:formylglycine-generating enzyme required for sulfatase activity